MTQLTFLPELPDSPGRLVYLITDDDGLLLKWGYTSQARRERQAGR